jgi:hypothetical protein
MQLSNFILAYKILKDLAIPYSEMDAFKLGIIDDKGHMIKSPSTELEKQSYDSYTRLILNMRRLLQRLIGTNPTVNKLATLLLLKEGVDSEVAKFVVKQLDMPSDRSDISDLQADSILESIKEYY